jgi:site-specific recombinase XerD
MSQTTVEQLMGHELEVPGNRQLFRGLRRDMEAAGRSPRTIATYNQGLRLLEVWLLGQGHDGDLAAVDRGLMTGWLTWLQQPKPGGGGYAKDSVVTYFRSVRRFYNFLADDDIIDRSPLVKIPEPKASGKPVDFPALDTIRALIATCHPKGAKPGFYDLRDEMIIRVFCEAGGPRVNEIASLPLDGLDLGSDLIQICGKGGKWRMIALSAKTAKAADKYMRARKTHLYAEADRVVLGQCGPMAPNGIWQMVQRRSRYAGVAPLHPHQFRHAAADRAKSAGMSDGDIMRLFGWSSPAMLHKYGSAQADRRAIEAARKLSLGNEL